MLTTLKKDLRRFANLEKAKILQRFFKTGKGQYGEADVFIGLTSEQIKLVAKKYSWLLLKDINDLLESSVHEDRVCALRILVERYNKSDEKNKKEIFNFYLANTKNINNWDLVDLSAPKIVGDFVFHNKEQIKVLYKLAKSKNLWEKRIAIVATYFFIRKESFEDVIAISEILLNDTHDLIHKAVGWMLREVGKKDGKILRDFLEKNYSDMPRTMLRYAIEKFPEDERKIWLRRK